MRYAVKRCSVVLMFLLPVSSAALMEVHSMWNAQISHTSVSEGTPVSVFAAPEGNMLRGFAGPYDACAHVPI